MILPVAVAALRLLVLAQQAPHRDVELADAAIRAETEDVSAEEILRVVNHESGGWRDARPGMRHWPHDPRLFPRKSHYVCGLMQNTARTAAECVLWIRDPYSALQAGAMAMQRWHAFCRSVGRRGGRRYRCARAGYARGVRSALDG